MYTPFVYGKLVQGKNFTNRENELARLKQNFISGINTILISPRRWGKSSLVKRAGDEVLGTTKSVRIVHLDMFNIRTEEDFYKYLSENLLRAVSGKLEDWVQNSKKFLKKLMPRITFSPEELQEVSFVLNWTDVVKQPDEILDLAENIANDKGIKIVICIDEFQNLSYFEKPLDFQKKLRSHWQNHSNVSYCLYGSKRNMLMEVFASPSMPFYKFGDLMFLQKISSEYWKKFIQERFNSTGKKIRKKQAEKIALLVENHPYYVQQLAQLCWLRTDKELDDEIIEETLNSLALQLSLLFQNMTENLSTSQVNFLRALLDGVKMFSSIETLRNYSLGTSANISRIKGALINKEIIDENTPGKIELLDPVYRYWLKEYYFNYQ